MVLTPGEENGENAQCPPEYEGPGLAYGGFGVEEEEGDGNSNGEGDDDDQLSNKSYLSLDDDSSPSKVTTSPTMSPVVSSLSLTTSTVTVSSGQQGPLSSISTTSSLDKDLAALELLKKQNAFLEEQAKLVEAQKVSAKRL